MIKPKNVYCIGLGGVGVSAVAKYFLQSGVKVSGSDLVHSPLVNDVIALGGTYYSDHDPARMSKAFDLVVYTDDCGPDHPERLAATRLGIPAQNFSETLGQIMADYPVRIAIAGTNGKSTTAALAGLLLAGADLDPTVFVGSRVSQFGGNLRYGGRKIFVAEADEYNDHFLNLHPTIAAITNIELDHVNYFHTLDRMIASYRQFVERLPPGSRLVFNHHDRVLREHFRDFSGAVTFGQDPAADLQVANLKVEPGQQTFDLVWGGEDIGHYALRIPGEFNVMNTAAAVATALSAGTEPQTFIQTISEFRGVWRRFQILTAANAPVTIVSDYAHHPTAVRGTLEGAKKFFPGRRIVAVFQPHHHNRLTALFDNFITSFDSADTTLIVEVYDVPGRKPEAGDNKTGVDLSTAISARHQPTTYVDTIDEASAAIKKMVQPGDVVIIMGAGDIWTIADPLARQYEK